LLCYFTGSPAGTGPRVSSTYKVNTDSRDVTLGVGVVGETKQQARLSNTGVSDEEELEEVIVSISVRLGKADRRDGLGLRWWWDSRMEILCKSRHMLVWSTLKNNINPNLKQARAMPKDEFGWRSPVWTRRGRFQNKRNSGTYHSGFMVIWCVEESSRKSKAPDQVGYSQETKDERWGVGGGD
jgi:hypothetical protein